MFWESNFILQYKSVVFRSISKDASAWEEWKVRNVLKREQTKKSQENNAEIFFLRIQSSQWSWQGTKVHNEGDTMAVGVETTYKARSCILKQRSQECNLCSDSCQANKSLEEVLGTKKVMESHLTFSSQKRRVPL